MSTLVGKQPAVRPLWETIGDTWGTPREERWEQPHLEQQLQSLVDTTKSAVSSLQQAGGSLADAFKKSSECKSLSS